ncbi:hypothetical protein EDB19DRAFT_849428 [Suillus lakei]|nr:hypothetical protein EDB19DRAFT_849428 [Suillus lakei]
MLAQSFTLFLGYFFVSVIWLDNSPHFEPLFLILFRSRVVDLHNRPSELSSRSSTGKGYVYLDAMAALHGLFTSYLHHPPSIMLPPPPPMYSSFTNRIRTRDGSDVESIKEKVDTTERLEDIRKLMAKEKLDY